MFVLGSVAKMIIFLVLCLAVEIFIPNVADGVTAQLVPSVIAIIVSYVFLTMIEQNKRSFFSKGYMLENLIGGIATGFCVIALALVAEWVFGNLRVAGVDSSYNFASSVAVAVSQGLFPALLIFGYIFHIIMSDFGCITAGIFCSLGYTAYECFHAYKPAGQLILAGKYDDPVLVPVILNFVLVGAVCSVMVYYFGDVRSAAGFLTFMSFTRAAAIGLLNPLYKGDFMAYSALNSSFMLTVALAAAFFILLTNAVKKDQ